jgi:hypothetical protein
MRRILILSVPALALVGLIASEAHAQMGHRYSVQFSALGATLFGEEFEEIDAGFGVEGQLRVTPGRFSIGLGLQYTQHGTTGFEGLEDMTFKLWGPFLEPRLVVDVGSDTAAPYLSGRLSILREQGNVDFNFVDEFGNVTPVEISAYAWGVLANAGGGVLFALSPRMNVDLGVTIGFGSFGEGTVEVEGTEVATFDGTSGGNVVFRAGVSFGL